MRNLMSNSTRKQFAAGRFTARAIILASAFCSFNAALDNAAHAAVSKSAKTTNAPTNSTAKALSEKQKIVHVLNRLAFGPRPNDVDDVNKIGVTRWIDVQLNPNSINDSVVEARLKSFQTLNYSLSQLTTAYASDQILRNRIKEARKKRQAEASGETFTSKLEKLNARQQLMMDNAQREGFEAGIALQIVAEMQNAKILRALESKRQLQEVLVDFWANHFNLDIRKREVQTLRLADERDVIRPHVLGKFRDLLGASAHSPAMLIYLDNASSSVETPIKFPNLFRLNRPVSSPRTTDTTSNSSLAKAAATPILPSPKTRGGVNENYAREMMELHTLGVGGGYTQKDVQEVARCFTGWSVDRETGAFRFYPKRHDDGEKTVLGHVIFAHGGENDGDRVLDILAAHPSTARFISTKLCQRLVADVPPPALVKRVAQVFLQTDGDLKAVTRAIVTSPEFMAQGRAKIKSPFEYAISAARALDATFVPLDARDGQERLQLVNDGTAATAKKRYDDNSRRSTARQIATMGEPLYSFEAPTGYSENSQDWVSLGALIARLNFALDLTNGHIPDLKISRAKLFDGLNVDDKNAWLNRLESLTLQGDVSASTRKTLASQIVPDAPFDAAKIGALLLGSPEFQRR